MWRAKKRQKRKSGTMKGDDMRGVDQWRQCINTEMRQENEGEKQNQKRKGEVSGDGRQNWTHNERWSNV